MTAPRSWWLVYGISAVLLLAALAGFSVLALKLERAERRAQTDAAFQESMRLAMWRLDSWVAPYLAREASRQHDDYRPFVSQPMAFKLDVTGARPDDVFVPSPLLAFRSDLFEVHFRLGDDGGLSSPQLPSEELRHLVAPELLDSGVLAKREEALARLGTALDIERVLTRLARAESTGGELAEAARGAPAALERLVDGEQISPLLATQQQKNEIEMQARISCAVDSLAPPEVPCCGTDAPLLTDAPTLVGPLTPLWLDGESAAEQPLLILVRRVQNGGVETLQGSLVNWSAMSGVLLDQVRDLFPAARLVATSAPERGGELASREMAMLPVRLVTARSEMPDLAWLTATRATLGTGWLVLAVTLALTGITLYKSIEFGVRRDRFVSAITHEMRTPLTTFRMYTGMLDDGIVTDPSQRETYLRTLRDEADRLSSTVENVLAYARLERGAPNAARFEQVTVETMLQRLVPPLERRAAEAGMTLAVEIESDDDRTADIDVHAVGQIVSNLVSNACKYAQGSEDPTIRLEAKLDDGALELRVRDNGPGIPDAAQRSIFLPFTRGELPVAEGETGVGLGLSISRGLAKEMGGRLELEKVEGSGASFVLSIPI